MYDHEVFERLAEAVAELEVPMHGDALAEVLAIVDRLNAKVSAAIGEYDASGQWEIEGPRPRRRGCGSGRA